MWLHLPGRSWQLMRALQRRLLLKQLPGRSTHGAVLRCRERCRRRDRLLAQDFGWSWCDKPAQQASTAIQEGAIKARSQFTSAPAGSNRVEPDLGETSGSNPWGGWSAFSGLGWLGLACARRVIEHLFLCRVGCAGLHEAQSNEGTSGPENGNHSKQQCARRGDGPLR